MNSKLEHICVCICTYKRPELLRRLLEALGKQVTDEMFTYSMVIVDNDQLHSAESTVSDFAASTSLPVRYCVEPEQNIPMARNKAVENASGDYVAFIDDDEFPAENWLLNLLKTCKQYNVDGAVGPVNCHFDQEPPKWIVKGRFWQRPTYTTGLVIDGKKGRTNNALVKRELFAGLKEPFRPEFRTGEDQEFFSHMIEEGHTFVWCNEALVYETVPPKRWERSFILKRSLLQGSISPLHRTFGLVRFAKSLIAVPVYAVMLPVAAILGQHRFMSLLVKLAFHLGAVLNCMGIKAVKQPYVTQ